MLPPGAESEKFTFHDLETGLPRTHSWIAPHRDAPVLEEERQKQHDCGSSVPSSMREGVPLLWMLATYANMIAFVGGLLLAWLSAL
jgi:hypothetical protein